MLNAPALNTLSFDVPGSDISNYSGGVGNVLETKSHPGAQTGHLGALAGVALYDNDRQLADCRCRRQLGEKDGYTVAVRAL